MAENDVIEYAMITGKIKPDNNDLTSNYSNAKGVIRVHELRQHGTVSKSNISTDSTKLLSRVTNDVPFSVVDANRVRAHVEDALSAEFLMENLDLTYSHFETVKTPTFEKLFDILASKDIIRGIETTEKILRTDTLVTAFGKIEKLPDSKSKSWISGTVPIPQYRISPPTNSNSIFIVTPLSKNAIIDRLTTSKQVLKASLIIFGSIGAAVGAYCAFKLLKEYYEKRKREKQLAEARLQRLKNQRERAQHYDDELLNQQQPQHDASGAQINSTLQNRNVSPVSEQSVCVICLINPREIVLLDCGHVCLCMNCLEQMPNTNCPICRQKYRTFVPCYIP